MNVEISNKDELLKALYNIIEYVKTDVGTNLQESADIAYKFANELNASPRKYLWSDYKHDAVQAMEAGKDPATSTQSG